ncbi:alpha/beta hydrolase [Actinoplanes sp. NBRC 101535]|uniref:alpha/beta hydrolase n=1 Tax=Actinoplanes sp. NBRC 101535 TaxID=3032196 RepID=UPI0024A579D2|nr:alpha/beta hydrolase [Actinoplanes sp. NBRC 101535]GLY00655.1 peptidase [Actinoplanes sp. NBRC 101535]
MRKAVPLILGLLALLAPTALTGPARAGIPAPEPAATGIAWGPCGPDEQAPARVLCGALTVPVDHAAPAGETLTLALAKRPATDPARRIGTLMFNPGGPGGSGVNFIYHAETGFSADLLARFDIVSYDPRGQARSRPVLCDSTQVDAQSALLYPDSPAEYAALRTANRALAEGCLTLTGPLLGHVDTAHVARDVDAIRAALGEEKISLFGVSYGTMISQQYAELFPHRIRALAMDSSMDHAQGIAGYQGWESVAMEESFGQFAAWCSRTVACALHGASVLDYFDALYADADAGDLVVDGAPVTPEVLVDAVFGYLYGPSLWFELADLLLYIGGDGLAPHGAQLPRGEPVRNGYLPVMCSDYHYDLYTYPAVAILEKAQNALARHTRLNPLAWTDLTGCQNWPYPVTNPPHRLRASPALPPILISNSRYDVATPYQWALGLAGQLPSSRVLTYDGVGHGTYWLSDCARQTIDDYLLAGVLPEAGAHCPAVFPSTPLDKQQSTLTSPLPPYGR